MPGKMETAENCSPKLSRGLMPCALRLAAGATVLLQVTLMVWSGQSVRSMLRVGQENVGWGKAGVH